MHAKNVKNYAKLLKTTTKFAVFEEKITKTGQHWPKKRVFLARPLQNVVGFE